MLAASKVRLTELTQKNIRRWIQDPELDYRAVRPYLYTFDLGFPFLFKGEFLLFLAKLFSLGKYEVPALLNDRELPHRHNSVALIVTYHPTDASIENIKKLQLQFGIVIVVDNSPVFNPVQFNSLTAGPELKILSNRNRNGLAGALNQGLRELCTLRESGWIFQFDQDSEICADFLIQIKKNLEKFSHIDWCNAVVGIDYNDGKTKPKSTPVQIVEPVRAVITSGSFLRIENLKRVGLYIDEMFIDSLDHEFCLRAARSGLQIWLIHATLMKHSLGDIHLKEILGKSDIITTNHAPFRWYYFARNLFFTLFEGFPWTVPWGVAHGYSLLKNYIKVLLFEKQKLSKTVSALKGSFAAFPMILRSLGLLPK